MKTKDLEEVVKMLRANGIESCKFDPQYNLYEVKFFEPKAFVAPEPDKLPVMTEEKKCPCGHLETTEHSGAGCLIGCDLELCIGRTNV